MRFLLDENLSPRLAALLQRTEGPPSHGVGNLSVAGSSVFPTGVYANSALTIVALAVRRTDHLEAVLPSR